MHSLSCDLLVSCICLFCLHINVHSSTFLFFKFHVHVEFFGGGIVFEFTYRHYSALVHIIC